MLEPRVYLEIRVLLESPRKAFCDCPASSGGGAPSCPICSRDPSRPGKKEPSLNPAAAATAYELAGILGARAVASPRWERFKELPELPPEYAISGLSLLIGSSGRLEVGVRGSRKGIGIGEIRMEEYSGRLIRVAGKTRMDYSRAGSPCLRLKTLPDFEFGQEAEAFLMDLRGILQYQGVIGTNFDSAVRCNAYVCLPGLGSEPSNYVKLRNLNSINFVRKAINAEINRQEEINASGGKVPPESRLWNEAESRTDRFKERAEGILARYEESGFGSFDADPALLAGERGLPDDLPTRQRERMSREYGVPYQDAQAVSEDSERVQLFNKAVEAGADAGMAARWIATEVARICRREGLKLSDSGLSPGRFASVLRMLRAKEIHIRMAKRLVEAVLLENEDPESIMEKRRWRQITDMEELSRIVDGILAERSAAISRIKSGESAPYEYIIGLVLERTQGLADPARVREILRKKVGCPFVYALAMGGAIVSTLDPSGVMVPVGDKRVKELLSEGAGELAVRAERVPVDAQASEEIAPADWAVLSAVVARRITKEGARGVVIAHGTDTLAYTAALCYWLFAESPVPIVLTASSASPDSSGEAKANLSQAALLAATAEGGVYVAMAGKLLSPLNLKFERIAPDGFRNWNMPAPIYRGQAVSNGIWDADEDILRSIFEDAIRKICVLRVYPGMRSEIMRAAIDSGARYLILELFDSGTANLRGNSFSLREAFSYARRRGVTVFCTSQQEGIVDFGRYSSSHGLIRAGALAMGGLTTESAYTRLIAASLEAESHEELMELMESGQQVLGP
jgi:aspartyl-tRNA(Asn)/glutamyl-tRNA(Gln) amidotransferase subunit B